MFSYGYRKTNDWGMMTCLICGNECRRKYCCNSHRQLAYSRRTALIRGKKNSEARTIEELLYVLRFYVSDKSISRAKGEEYVRVLLTLYQDERTVTL